MTFAEETAAMRAKAGVRTITHEELQALTNTTRTATRAASDVYANPPDGYALAFGCESTRGTCSSTRARA